MPSIWVAVLHISDPVAQKIIHVHGLDPDDVRAAIVTVRGVPFSRHVDPERGERYIARTTVGSRLCLVVLYATDDRGSDEWNLGSAYPIDRS